MSSNDEFERFKQRVYSRTDEEGNQVIGVSGGGPSTLMTTRLRRCQNCLHFDQGEDFDKKVKHCIARDRKVLHERGEGRKKVGAHLRRLTMTLATGEWGLCKIGDKRTDENAHADFTHYVSRCDMWSGRLIVSPHDATPDPDAAEVYDKLGLTPKPGK